MVGSHVEDNWKRERRRCIQRKNTVEVWLVVVRKLDSIFGLDSFSCINRLIKSWVCVNVASCMGAILLPFPLIVNRNVWLTEHMDWNLKCSCCSYQLYCRSSYSLLTHMLIVLLKWFTIDYSAKLVKYLGIACCNYSLGRYLVVDECTGKCATIYLERGVLGIVSSWQEYDSVQCRGVDRGMACLHRS